MRATTTIQPAAQHPDWMIVVAWKRRTVADAGHFRERLLRMRLSVSGETPRYDASIH